LKIVNYVYINYFKINFATCFKKLIIMRPFCGSRKYTLRRVYNLYNLEIPWGRGSQKPVLFIERYGPNLQFPEG